MRYIPLSFFGSSETASAAQTDNCYCDTATFTLSGGAPNGAARRIQGTECNLQPLDSCYAGSVSGTTRTIYIKKGTNITVSTTGICNGGNISAITYNRNFCAGNYNFMYFNFNITNCKTGTSYVATFLNFDGYFGAGDIYNFTNINSLSAGVIPNGCYTIGALTASATQTGANFLVPSNYNSYSSCNECNAAV